MSERFVFVGDLIEKNGNTVRENNLMIKHKIPVGALVECVSDDYDYEWIGIRLYVVNHQRDCDGTPLYGLGEKNQRLLLSGFGEESLVVIK